MGSCMSLSSTRIDRQEMVSRCRARKNYMKQLLVARQALCLSHSFYFRSLRSAGAALLQFATGESNLHLHRNPYLPRPSMSPSTDTTSTTASSAAPPPPSVWDFWDPFASGAQLELQEEEWEDATTTTSNAPAMVLATESVETPPSVVSGFSKEVEAVVSKQGKEFVEIIKELDDYFVKAADARSFVSGVLEFPDFSDLPSFSGNLGKNRKNFGGFEFVKLREEDMVMEENKMGIEVVDGGNLINGRSRHSHTLERLYAWEKKLLLEIRNAERLKIEHEKKAKQLRSFEAKRVDYMKTEKSKTKLEKIESQMEVAAQAISTASAEIIKLRETQLYPQILNLVKGFMCMWRSMYECHQVQTHIVNQLKFLNSITSIEPTSEIHHQSTLQLEYELQKWLQAFCNLVKAQRDYISSLSGWLRLSLFEFNNLLTRTIQDSIIYSLCEEWQLAMDRVPDKVASEGINSLLSVIHAIVVQQEEEHKQEKKLEAANKQLEKMSAKLRSIDAKYGSVSMPESGLRNRKDPVEVKRVKVEKVKAKVEEEKVKFDKVVKVTRAMVLNNMQMGLPHVFQAITGFSSVCMLGFESVYNWAKSLDQEKGVKKLMMA